MKLKHARVNRPDRGTENGGNRRWLHIEQEENFRAFLAAEEKRARTIPSAQ